MSLQPMPPVSGSTPIRPTQLSARPKQGPQAKGSSFGDALAQSLRSMDGQLQGADKAAEQVAAGKGDVQEAVLGMVRAELDLRVALAVRDRVVEAYRDLERMAL